MSATKYRILLVDDSPEDQELYRRLLTKGCEEDYDLIQVDSGDAGLEQLRRNQFDCVLLDYRLPDRDGLDLLSEWTQTHEMPLVAVVMLTGQGSESVAVQALQGGAQDYLVKTRFTPERLRSAVQSAIDKVTLQRQIEAQRRELERLATHDDLTGLHNRRAFMERLDQEIIRAQRTGTPLSTIIMDIDHFKRINDRLGHLAGDQVLTMVAQRLRSGLRRTDFAARYGGEEFCILAIDTDLQGAGELAERLRVLIGQEEFRVSAGHELHVTCSFGVGQYNGRLSDPERLVAAADTALYEAKAAGRDRVCHVTLQG